MWCIEPLRGYTHQLAAVCLIRHSVLVLANIFYIYISICIYVCHMPAK